MMGRFYLWLISIAVLFCFGVCKKDSGTGNPNLVTPPATNDMDYWLTKSDQTVLLQKQAGTISFGNPTNAFPTLEVDSTLKYQSIDGFGYTLTGGSAYLINHMGASDKSALLNELFGNSADAIGVSYLRISIGASDLNTSVFSYDDMPAGQTDTALANFNLSQDTLDLIPVLKQILAINPRIKLLGSPWSAPVWMKDNGSTVGGTLQSQYFPAYARYFVKYVRKMQLNGITIDAITIQNEPQNPGNNPSLVFSALQEADFIKNHLGPAFQAAGITTKIIGWDHNCDNPGYPITILNDAGARPFINGSAFHLYAGDISALSTVHNAYPNKDLYFTEQWTSSTGTFDGDLIWHIKNVIIGSMRNWSKTALEWNLASDPNYLMHTPGGCSQCKGAITISGAASRNVSYYIIAQIAKFVPPGSVRISSTEATNLSNVAFLRPDGRKVLMVLNEGNAVNFNILFKGSAVVASMPANAAATFIW